MAKRSPAHATVCVTGATGFLGAQLAAALCEEGHRVRVTYRDRSRLDALDGLDVEPVRADTLDRAAMRRAARGCDALFHVAGMVGASPAERIYEVNARGPRVAVEAAAAEGVSRVILTSSVAGVGPAPPGAVADETQEYRTGDLSLTYINAKHEGEGEALAAAARTGVDLVITCPSYVLGPGHARHIPGESSTRIVGNYMRGRLPAAVDGNTNIVDVEDVAAGHLLAWRKGRPGERYILGGDNTRWSKVLGRISALSGIRHPIVFIPVAAEPFARAARAMGLPTPISFEAVELMAQNWHYSSAKAERELGYRHRGLEETLRRTVDWYVELIEGHRFDDGLSPLGTMAAGVQAASRLGGPLPGLLGAGARALARRREWR